MEQRTRFNLKQSGIAVDIDETLAWTVGRMTELMMKEFGNPEGLSVKAMVEKYRYVQGVPYWNHAAAMDWIKSHNYSDEAQKELPLIDGANDALAEINKIIPIAAYVTARPESVLAGTKHWLKKHAFPEAPIICKPAEAYLEDNNEWKARLLQGLYPEIVGIIDDNPRLLDFLFPGYQGYVFIYDHKDQERRPDRVAFCLDWPQVIQAVRKSISDLNIKI